MQPAERTSSRRGQRSAAGLTLVELTLVITVLAIVAGIALFRGRGTLDTARADATRASLLTIRDACLGTPQIPGFHGDLGELPLAIADLFELGVSLPSGASVMPWDRFARRGWNGPYLRNPTGRYTVDPDRGFLPQYGAEGDPALFDAWNRPIVLQRPVVAGLTAESVEAAARLISAGPDGVIDTRVSQELPDPQNPTDVGDDIVIYLARGVR